MERGQAHTLEAVVAGLLLLASIIYALQMTAVTPLSASTSSQHIENQQRSVATGVLATATSANALKPTVLFFNNSTGQFHDTGELGYYTNQPPDTRLGRMLNRSFDQEGISYNVYLVTQTSDGDSVRKKLVYRGVPSDNAVRAGRSVTLTDDDHLYDADGTRNASTVSEASRMYAEDVGGVVYNTVRVEVVVWRI